MENKGAVGFVCVMLYTVFEAGRPILKLYFQAHYDWVEGERPCVWSTVKLSWYIEIWLYNCQLKHDIEKFLKKCTLI